MGDSANFNGRSDELVVTTQDPHPAREPRSTECDLRERTDLYHRFRSCPSVLQPIKNRLSRPDVLVRPAASQWNYSRDEGRTVTAAACESTATHDRWHL